jgi:uncharacterized membrane protein YqhA
MAVAPAPDADILRKPHRRRSLSMEARMSAAPPPEPRRERLARPLAATRYLLFIAVFGCLLTAAAVLAFAAALVLVTVRDLFGGAELSAAAGKSLALTAIQAIDLFLIATVAWIAGVGIYTLFISRTVPGPLQLGIESLDDLKSKVVGVIVVALGVLFLGDALNWGGGIDLLYLGAAVALVIAALGYFLQHKG